MKSHNLYLVTSEEQSAQRSTFEVAQSAISGGVDIIQMREKTKSREEKLRLGRRMAALCKKRNVLFIVNDDPLLAKELRADGVHLGQEDVKKYSIEASRNILGKDKIIGVSTHSLEEFKRALGETCDYIAFGPLFPTKTKDYSIGISDVENVLALATRPVVFIGGITRNNIDTVLAKGAKHIAVIRAITEADDIKTETNFLKGRLASFCGRK